MNQIIAEFIGTYIFILIVLIVTDNKKFSKITVAFFISIGMFFSILLTKYIYDKANINFNPALTSTSLIKGDLNFKDFFILVFTQILSAILAYYTFKIIKL